MARLDDIIARCEVATKGPWERGFRQYIGGAVRENKTCAYCRHGEPSWVGMGDINGKRMLSHVHETAEPWDSRGIFAYRKDGSVCVVDQTDEYGMDSHDAEFIANARKDVWDMVSVLKALSTLHVRADGSKTGNKIINLCSCGEYWPCEERLLIDGLEG